jgi:hypothetical protein
VRITLTQTLDGQWLYAVHERLSRGRWLPVANGGPHATAEDALWRAEEMAALTREWAGGGETNS